MTMHTTTAEQIKTAVREKYGAIAAQVAATTAGGAASCCGPADCGCGGDPSGVITSGLYELGQTEGLPPDVLTASLGCGNPTALAELQSGETVLDLGSGGGIDVLLSATRVGPYGVAYGLDMTDEMLALARKNQQEAGVTNATFLKGEIEAVPLPDASVDVIVSNCVINLSSDKSQVLAEAFRVLKPGGRLAVSDIVRRSEVPPDVQQDMELWAGCIAGALLESDYRKKLVDVGFEDIEIEPTRIYSGEGGAVDAYMSAFIRGTKPSEQ
jgi:SAM-dependent methyltransferase